MLDNVIFIYMHYALVVVGSVSIFVKREQTGEIKSIFMTLCADSYRCISFHPICQGLGSLYIQSPTTILKVFSRYICQIYGSRLNAEYNCRLCRMLNAEWGIKRRMSLLNGTAE